MCLIFEKKLFIQVSFKPDKVGHAASMIYKPRKFNNDLERKTKGTWSIY